MKHLLPLLALWLPLAALADTTQVNRLNQAAQQLRLSDAPASLARAREALQLAQATRYPQGVAEALANIGIAFRNQNQYDSALHYLLAALKANEEAQAADRVAANLNSIGSVYYFQNQPDKAKEFYERALAIYETTGNELGRAASFMGLGVVYRPEPDKALAYCLRASAIYDQTGNHAEKAQNLNNIGNIYRAKGDKPKARQYFERAAEINRLLGNRQSLVVNLTNIGETYQQDRDNQQAETYYLEAVRVAIAGNLKLASAQCYRRLVEFYKAQGKYELALEYLDKAVENERAIYSDEQGRQISQLQTIYETKQKQQENDALRLANQRQQIVVVAGAVVLSLLGALAVVFFRGREKMRQANSLSDKLLASILPEEVAAELKAMGRSIPRSYERVTVLFTDLRGFTQLAESLSPWELVQQLDHCFLAFDEIIEKHGLEKIKTLGDGYLCAGGVPVPNDTNPTDAVRAGLAMQDFMRRWNQERTAAGEPTLELRVGIHTGRLVAGVVGKHKFAYDIWGDTVNLASRMESSGEPGRVNISGATYELVRGSFVCTHRGKVHAKNKGEVDMYFVEGETV
jgi:class 3 adenylate cyclase